VFTNPFAISGIERVARMLTISTILRRSENQLSLVIMRVNEIIAGRKRILFLIWIFGASSVCHLSRIINNNHATIQPHFEIFELIDNSF
jgi:hypothetical protein